MPPWANCCPFFATGLARFHIPFLIFDSPASVSDIQLRGFNRFLIVVNCCLFIGASSFPGTLTSPPAIHLVSLLPIPLTGISLFALSKVTPSSSSAVWFCVLGLLFRNILTGVWYRWDGTCFMGCMGWYQKNLDVRPHGQIACFADSIYLLVYFTGTWSLMSV